MATLMGAIERLRAYGKLTPEDTVSVVDLYRRYQVNRPGSLRDLQAKMFSSVAVNRPWAVILCRFKGSSPDPAVEDPIGKLFHNMFSPGAGGLVEYWRDASLGSISIVGSRVFGWTEVDIPRDQAGGGPPTGPGRSGLVDAAIRAVQRAGMDPLKGFHSQIAVYSKNWSTDDKKRPAGTPNWEPTDPLMPWWTQWIDGSADSRGKVTLTPPHNLNITAHEMGHGFGMNHDVGGPDFKTHYADPCCIVSQNGAYTDPRWGLSGPALCFAHLVQQDWMYKRRIYYDAGTWLTQAEGVTLPLAPITAPSSRANLGIKLAYANGKYSWDYYLEYVNLTEWNRGVVGGPYLFIRRIVDSDVGPTPGYIGAIGIGHVTDFVDPVGNVRFRVQQTNLPGPIIEVNAKQL